jgi:alpha-beta hydrolase superfamily lysophospholipase
MNRILVAAAASVALATTPLHAQGAERAVFLITRGADTLAMERASNAGRAGEGTLLVGGPVVARIGQQVTLSESGTVERVVTTIWKGARGDTLQQRSVLTFQGDSAVAHVEKSAAPTPPPDQRFRVNAGSIPFVNLSGLSVELLLRRARALGRDTVRIPVIVLGGGSMTATVVRLGADSVVMVMGGVAIRVHTDSAGRLLGAMVPSQSLVFERLPADAPAAAWAPRSVVTAPVSYAAPAGAPYTAEDVKVRTPDGLTLAGTLTVPAHRPGTRVPAVVLITGSGAQDRDEMTPYLEQWRPFREIADTLSRRGIAVLRLDDRGVGGSDAGSATATSADFADDIRAAVAWLRARPEVNATRVGLVGHSEGAIIAPMVAAGDARLRGIVLLAGTATTGRQISESQIRYLFDQDTTITRTHRDSLLVLAMHEADSVFAIPGWQHFFASYDPLPTARRVRVPTLILQGETDRQVPPVQARMLADAMRAAGNRHVTVRTFPRMNHLMVEDATGDLRRYRDLPSYRVRKDLLGTLADWLAQTL